MDNPKKIEPIVRISHDDMEAYLMLPNPFGRAGYDISEVSEALQAKGVKIGINETKVRAMVNDHYYDRECLIAKGIEVVDGVDAYYDYNFDVDFNKKPTRREDGTLDYWSIHSVEIVEEGQLIATYHEPIDGSNGMNVKGKLLMAKRGRPLPALTGKGFERSEDNITYTAAMTGKIEMKGNRIMISQVHEIHGDVGLKTGNIDFRGDVIIHGNVPTGAVVKATGTITIDGNVEGALIDANKDIIIRGGMLGGEKGVIKTRGTLTTKFLQYCTVKAEGSITADSIINSNIICNDRLYLEGKHASVVGGIIQAAKGVEAFNFGNEYGVKTEVYVGVTMEVKKQLNYHESSAKEAQEMIEKINAGLKQLDDMAKAQGIDMKNDPRKASLLRTKIIKQAELASHTQQLNYMTEIVENAHGARVKAYQKVHVGVIIGVNDSVVTVQEFQKSVAYMERDGHIVMYSLKDELI